MDFGGLLLAAVVFTQTAWSVFGLEDEKSSYYELWASRFDSVQFEMKILRGKVTKGERQLASMRSELESIRTAYNSKIEICNKTDMSGPVADNDVDVVDENADHVLRRAFMDEKLYTRELEQRVQTALLNATNIMHRVKETINVTVDENKNAFDEISRQIASLERQTKTYQESQQSIHANTNNAIDKLTKELARMHNIVRDQGNSIDRLGGKRCQTGSFGDHTFPGISFPKIYRVNFQPSFMSEPNFMYALHLLDSSAGLRVNVHLVEVNKDFAKVKIHSWADTKLYGARVRWMACP